MKEFLPWLNVFLNVFMIPILILVYGIKVELAKLNSTTISHGNRLTRIERREDEAVERREADS